MMEENMSFTPMNERCDELPAGRNFSEADLSALESQNEMRRMLLDACTKLNDLVR